MDAADLESGQMKLAVVELLDRDGHVRQFVPVRQWPVTIGRAIDCDVVLDDPHASPHHASVTEVDGALRLVVGETVNGVFVGRRRFAAMQTAELAAGDVLEIGSTRLSVRRAVDPLAPDARSRPRPCRSTAVVLLAGVLVMIAGRTGDGRSRRTGDHYLLVMVSSLLALVAWTSFGRSGRSSFATARSQTTRVDCAQLPLVSALVATILPLVALPQASRSSAVWRVAAASIVCAMVVAHLTLILPARRRFLVVTMTSSSQQACLCGSPAAQSQERFFNELYVTTMARRRCGWAPPNPPRSSS